MLETIQDEGKYKNKMFFLTFHNNFVKYDQVHEYKIALKTFQVSRGNKTIHGG